RLRPILMTAFATIMALVPLALTTSSGTLISKGLALTVIGGLTTSTLLTLIIVPVVYELFFFKKVKKERQS
ncbi:efflux RND transporter permease subunit, partial [Bifidobacterium pseudocatenulatum]|nr:efflux RND transporter permease subunit [Bifidobacterium pseudocatenulatum]